MNLHPFYHVSSAGKLSKFPDDQLDDDVRGLVMIWEPPVAGAQYYMGVDPTVGIVDWSREFRSEADNLTDNGAIEIIRKGTNGRKDRQVCEFVAPIHSEDLADHVNLLGRLYGLNDDDGQCPCIIEVYPGPGLMTQRRLINHFGYTNLFVWKHVDAIGLRATGSLGWFMGPKSKRDLWGRGLRHITRGGLEVNSEWLVEEMADCTPDTMGYSAKGTRHDDRVVATLLALWFLREWDFEISTEPTIESGPGERMVDPQASDFTSEEYGDWCEARFEEIGSDSD